MLRLTRGNSLTKSRWLKEHVRNRSRWKWTIFQELKAEEEEEEEEELLELFYVNQTEAGPPCKVVISKVKWP